MMKRLFFALLLLTCFLSQTGAQERPKLVVGIVADQMRWEYLYRYYDRYGNDGLKRMLNEGYSCDNMHFNYVPTVTAVGHCSVYAGTTPAFTGIVGNNFYVNGRKIYCCEDTTVQTVGSDSKAGQMSPRNSMVTSMCDQLRLATDFSSKTIGIALKDRAAILPAGHSANGAYWFDKSAGGFITSTFYMNELPKWVRDFNKSHRIDPKTEVHAAPLGVTLTTDMALAALDGENLGRNASTDFLAVSYSSTDYVGHAYGTRGGEIDEIYLTLDAELARLFSALDAKIGRDNYLVFLTADHAADHNAKFMNDHRLPGGHISSSELRKMVNQALTEKYGRDKLVLDIIENRLYLDHDALQRDGLNAEEVMRTACDELLKSDLVQYAVPFSQVATAPIPPAIRDRIVMGYCPKRSGDIQIIPRTAYTGAAYEQGTTHGAWTPDNTHVPFVLMGWSVAHGSTNKPVVIPDIAATICALLKIQMPSGCIGNPVF